MEKSQNLAVLSLDILLQLSSPNREISEYVFYSNYSALLAGHHRFALNLPGNFKVKTRAFGSIAGSRCHNMKVGKGAEGGKGFATKAEGLEGGEVIVGRKFGRVVLQSYRPC
jgi:hypothetical protein